MSRRAVARGPLLAASLLLAAGPARAAAPEIASFLYLLASPTGVVHSTWAGVTYDRAHDETFVVGDGTARIFDRSGMEVYRFGRDDALGTIIRVAPLPDGDLVVISWLEGRRTLSRCDYRGQLLERIELKGIPPEVPRPFDPDTVEALGDALYFAETSGGRVLVTDLGGEYRAYYDLPALAKLPRKSEGVGGVSVAADGQLLFTIPTLYSAFVVTPGGAVRQFGVKGSRPGRFNIVGKMVSDEQGNLFLIDRLRCVVMVFDRDLKFLAEFGYRGPNPGNMAGPFDVAVGNGKLFVSQARNIGVKVYKLSLPGSGPEQAAPSAQGTP